MTEFENIGTEAGNMEDALLRYCAGEADETERNRVEIWLQESDEHRRLFRQIALLLMAAEVEDNPARRHVDEALRKVHGRMRRRMAVRLFKGLQRVAALLFLPLLGVLVFLYMELDAETGHMVEVRTNPGMQTTVTLPDSSTVVLNSSSCLTYPERFAGKKREVTLTGEGYFSVRKDAGRHFVVHTLDNACIEVLGTEFNVDAYAEERTVRTTLVSGRVSFTYRDSCKQGTVLMQPGERLIYAADADTIGLQRVNVDVETAWKDGKLIFRKTPFEDILRMLGRRYNVRFVLKNEALKTHAFTGEFEGEFLPRVLEKFSLSSNITFRQVKTTDVREEKQIIEVY